jgi:hypothetical protein
LPRSLAAAGGGSIRARAQPSPLSNASSRAGSPAPSAAASPRARPALTVHIARRAPGSPPSNLGSPRAAAAAAAGSPGWGAGHARLPASHERQLPRQLLPPDGEFLVPVCRSAGATPRGTAAGAGAGAGAGAAGARSAGGSPRPPRARPVAMAMQGLDSPTQRLETLRHRLPELAELLALSPRSDATATPGGGGSASCSPLAGGADSAPLLGLWGGGSGGSSPGGSPHRGAASASEPTSLVLWKVPASGGSPKVQHGVSKPLGRGRKLMSLQVRAPAWRGWKKEEGGGGGP